MGWQYYLQGPLIEATPWKIAPVTVIKNSCLTAARIKDVLGTEK